MKRINRIGCKIICDKKIVSQRKNILVDNYKNQYHYDFVINAAGAHAIKIAEIMDIETDFVLLPFRGMYLKSKKISSFNTHIYPVPNISKPFLGIHTTLTSDGYLKLG